MKGRKRHVVTDTLGLLLVVHVHSASVQDRDAGPGLALEAFEKYPTLKILFADSAYAGRCASIIKERTSIAVEVSRRWDDRCHGVWQGPGLPQATAVRGFVPLPKRWVVERTHAWTDRPRRMAKDFDQRCDVSEAWIWLVQASLLLRRVAEPAGCEQGAVAA